MISLSRPISFWFVSGSNQNIDYYMEGSPVDRFVYILLIVMSLVVLFRRSVYLLNVLRNNWAIFLFFLYCAVSITWSDYPYISFKRWIKAIGSYSVILIILSENNPTEAIKTVIRRCALVLIPLSVCFIKYFPSIGRGYSEWTGEVMYRGVTGNKNLLGNLCLVTSLFLLSDLVNTLGKQRKYEKNINFLITIIVLIMTLWLIYIADSATSSICLLIGFAIIAGSKLDFFRRHSKHVAVYIVILFLIYYLLDTNFNITEIIIAGMGRNITLTDRTIIWDTVLNMGTNPWIGTGYESFWLGSRMAHLKEIFPFTINQAHNGYIEIFLNLGYIGLLFLSFVIFSGFLNASKKMAENYNGSVLCLAIISVLLFYNVTEAAFKDIHSLWNLFILMTFNYTNLMTLKEKDTLASNDLFYSS